MRKAWWRPPATEPSRSRAAPRAGRGDRGRGVVVQDPARELGAGRHAELPEHLAEVVLHGAGADEQPGSDVPVSFPLADQCGDLGLLRGELLRRTDLPL